MQNKNKRKKLKKSVKSEHQSWWSELSFREKIALPTAAVLFGVFGYNYIAAPEVKRPLYSSREDCLADWANTPQDCKEDTSNDGVYFRRWYGPWMDSRGTVYHENNTRSQRTEASIQARGFSSSSRLGFGSSGGSSRGG